MGFFNKQNRILRGIENLASIRHQNIQIYFCQIKGIKVSKQFPYSFPSYDDHCIFED